MAVHQDIVGAALYPAVFPQPAFVLEARASVVCGRQRMPWRTGSLRR